MKILGVTVHFWSWARRLTAAAFLSLLLLGAHAGGPWLSGSLSASRLLETVPLVDPLAALETLLASRALAAEAILGATILLISAILLGPVFCGWICPLGLLLDLNHALRHMFRQRFFPGPPRPLAGPLPPWIRYAVLGGLLGFALAAKTPLFQIVSPINLMVRSVLFQASFGLAAVAQRP